MTAVTTKEQSLTPTQQKELAAFTAGGLVCPNGCATDWRFYEEVTAGCSVFISSDDEIIVNVGDVAFDGSYDARFECSGCCYGILADKVAYDNI